MENSKLPVVMLTFPKLKFTTLQLGNLVQLLATDSQKAFSQFLTQTQSK